MRKELYRMLCRELKAIDLIKHIDLWNHNVEFIEYNMKSVYVFCTSLSFEFIASLNNSSFSFMTEIQALNALRAFSYCSA